MIKTILPMNIYFSAALLSRMWSSDTLLVDVSKFLQHDLTDARLAGCPVYHQRCGRECSRGLIRLENLDDKKDHSWHDTLVTDDLVYHELTRGLVHER